MSNQLFHGADWLRSGKPRTRSTRLRKWLFFRKRLSELQPLLVFLKSANLCPRGVCCSPSGRSVQAHGDRGRLKRRPHCHSTFPNPCSHFRRSALIAVLQERNAAQSVLSFSWHSRHMFRVRDIAGISLKRRTPTSVTP